jgi:hypothetical protein
VLNLWLLLNCTLMRFLYKYLARSVMPASQLSGEILDSFFSFFKTSLPTSLIHFSDYSIFICRFCILFNIWIDASLRFTNLFFLVRSVICDNITYPSYYFQTFIYSNILNIVTFWFSDSPISNIRIHMEPSDYLFRFNILIVFL